MLHVVVKVPCKQPEIRLIFEKKYIYNQRMSFQFNTKINITLILDVNGLGCV